MSSTVGKVVRFDHLTFFVGNAKASSSYFVTRFGFQPLAIREPTDENPVISYAVRLNEITVVFQSSTTSDNTLSMEVFAHGDFVKDVAFEVSDVDSLTRAAKTEGADILKGVTQENDEYGSVKYSVLKTYGNNTHTLMDRSNYNGPLLPGYKALECDPTNESLAGTNLIRIDHVEANLDDGSLDDHVTWYEKHLNMHKFWCVDFSHDLAPYSCINSAAVTNPTETILLSMNEATKGIRPSSKVTDFIKAQGAAGVEHVALYTDDIVSTMRNLKSRGAEILSWPATYYDVIKEKLKQSSLKVLESVDELKEHNILIDFDEKGYMLQAFTSHLQVRPTLFIEIIQRRNHNGFGAQNYKWVFEAIERLETTTPAP